MYNDDTPLGRSIVVGLLIGLLVSAPMLVPTAISVFA